MVDVLNLKSLKAENFKRLKAVALQFDENDDLVIIGGNNSQGKSTTLDIVMETLGGKKNVSQKPLRDGAKIGFTEVNLGSFVAKRYYSLDGPGKVVVTSNDGGKYGQTLLNSLYNSLTFDPSAFYLMDSDRQLDTLKSLVGLDFTEQDKKRKAIYDERTAINRDVKQIAARIKAMETYSDVPEKEVSVQELMKELENQEDISFRKAEAIQVAKNLEADKNHWAKEAIAQREAISDLERELIEAKESLKKFEKLMMERKNEHEIALENAEKLPDGAEDEVKEKIQAAEGINEKVRANNTRKDLESELNETEKASKDLTAKIQEIDDAKQADLASAQFPVPGLSFDENGVLLNGLPFEQAADSDRLKVSVAMGIAMNPKLKLMLIRNGEKFDKENMKSMAKMAKEAGFIFLMERVGDGDEGAIIIEDGLVKESEEGAINIIFDGPPGPES